MAIPVETRPGDVKVATVHSLSPFSSHLNSPLGPEVSEWISFGFPRQVRFSSCGFHPSSCRIHESSDEICEMAGMARLGDASL